MEGESSKTYVFGQDSGIPAWAMNNGLFGNNSWGGGIVGFILGLLFGNNGWGGFGGLGGGNGSGAAGFLSNQMNNDAGRELLMNAITSTGEAQASAIQNLASAIGQDFNIVNGGVQSVIGILNGMATQQAVSVPQIINAIQSGDAALTSQLNQCCCNMKQLVMEQGYQAQIATLNQTNQLGSQADRNANSIISAINAQTVAMNDGFCAIKERELQSKIDSLTAANTVLRNQVDNMNQTQIFANMLAPISAKLVEIESRQPQTVPVVYPNLVATPVTTGSTGA